MTKTNNDERILKLKEQIKLKKEELKNQPSRFTPVTNCLIELDGLRHNINVLNNDGLTLLLVKLNMYLNSAKELELELNIDGYNVEEWMEDVKNKLSIMNRKNEERKLKVMEAKLDQLLSEEKQTELMIDEIEDLLK